MPTNSERTPAETEADIDGIGGLVNIYHAVTAKECPRHLALGMATSAVSQLLFEREMLRDDVERLAREHADRLTRARQEADKKLSNLVVLVSQAVYDAAPCPVCSGELNAHRQPDCPVDLLIRRGPIRVT